MNKKIILILVCIFFFTGCEKKENNDKSESGIFTGIFEDNISFFDVDNQMETTLTEYKNRIGSTNTDGYILCDLDGDNVDELICGFTPIQVTIFHYGDNNKVYSYLVSSRFNFFKTGEIYSAFGASTGAIVKIKEFNEKTYTTTVLAKSEIDGEDIVYYLNDEKVSSEKYWDYHNSLGEYLSWNKID